MLQSKRVQKYCLNQIWCSSYKFIVDTTLCYKIREGKPEKIYTSHLYIEGVHNDKYNYVLNQLTTATKD